MMVDKQMSGDPASAGESAFIETKRQPAPHATTRWSSPRPILGVLLGVAVAVMVGIGCQPTLMSSSQAAGPGENDPNPTIGDAKMQPREGEDIAIIAGGCFWCTEAVYERMKGVTKVVSGYTGGHVPNPTYEQVCSKLTGHAEAVAVFFDPKVTTFEDILAVFFKTHDPTTLNRQGADVGPQYRSSVFYRNEEQKKIAAAYIKKLDESGEYRNPIVTKLEPESTFYVAENYHQDYFRLNARMPYCKNVIAPKVRKFNYLFKDKIKGRPDPKSKSGEASESKSSENTQTAKGSDEPLKK